MKFALCGTAAFVFCLSNAEKQWLRGQRMQKKITGAKHGRVHRVLDLAPKDCGSNNPCTPENIANDMFYFTHADPTKYVQCGAMGGCDVMPCAPGTNWDQRAKTCNVGNGSTQVPSEAPSEPPTSDPTPSPSDDPSSFPSQDPNEPKDCDDNNPCTPANAAKNMFHFTHTDPAKFVQCDAEGGCFVMPCAEGTRWDQQAEICNVENNALLVTTDVPRVENTEDPVVTSTRKPDEETTEEPDRVTTKGPVDCEDNNPCTRKNIAAGNTYFSHFDSSKYVKCDEESGGCCVMTCVTGAWDQVKKTCFGATTSTPEATEEPPMTTTNEPFGESTTEDPNRDPVYTDCDENNPCTPENIVADNLYHAHFNSSYFVQCSKYGKCFELPCATGTEWDQSLKTCIHTHDTGGETTSASETTEEPCDESTTDEPRGASTTEDPNKVPIYTDCEENNPCTPENIMAENLYHAHFNSSYFVQCSENGRCFERQCAAGTEWDQNLKTCTADGGTDGEKTLAPQTTGESRITTTTDEPHGASTTEDPNREPVYTDCEENNPCTQENIDAGHFYHAHSNPSYFVQCSGDGRCFELPCATGTEWNQTVETCTIDGRNGDRNNTLPTGSTTQPPNIADCQENNPCTPENYNSNNWHHAHSDPSMFIMCGGPGICFELSCPPGLKWNQNVKACIKDSDDDNCDPNPCKNGGTCTDGVDSFTCDCSNTGYDGDKCENPMRESDTSTTTMPPETTTVEATTKEPTEEPSEQPSQSPTSGPSQGPSEAFTTLDPNRHRDCEADNPCTPENIAAGNMLHAHADPFSFVMCGDEAGDCCVLSCIKGTQWDQTQKACSTLVCPVMEANECMSNQDCVDQGKAGCCVSGPRNYCGVPCNSSISCLSNR